MTKPQLIAGAALLLTLLTSCGTNPANLLPSSSTTATSSTSAPSASAKSHKPSATPTTTPSQDSKPATGTALAALDQLVVKGRAPKTGYSRDAFGPAWSDTDHNGCDTRNDILTRDLTNITYRARTHDCVVLTGDLDDPYSALDAQGDRKKIHFVRGQTTSLAVQIDHVVALSAAWQTGANTWPAAKRLAYANDPRVLLAADGPLNESKSDSDAASWLPPNKAYRCDYVARQILIKAHYDLWVVPAEKQAMANVLATCPKQKLPS